MLKPVYRVDFIMNRYGCAASTARKYMREMEHTERPLTVTEDAIRDWEETKTIPSLRDRNEKASKRKRKAKMPRYDGHIVPRART